MNKYSKIFISLLSFIVAIFLFIKNKYSLGSFFILNSIIFIFLFFRNEYLLLGFFCIQKKNIKGLEKWLSFIKNPNLQLIKSQKAYFYFLKGISIAQSNIIKSEKYIKKSLEIGLKFKYNRAIAKLNLSAISLSKGEKRRAEILALEAKKLDKTGILSDQIKIIKEQIKKTNIKRNIQNPNIRQQRKFF